MRGLAVKGVWNAHTHHTHTHTRTHHALLFCLSLVMVSLEFHNDNTEHKRVTAEQPLRHLHNLCVALNSLCLIVSTSTQQLRSV